MVLIKEDPYRYYWGQIPGVGASILLAVVVVVVENDLQAIDSYG